MAKVIVIYVSIVINMEKIFLKSSKDRYFIVMKWSNFITNGCDLMCTNTCCAESYSTICNSTLYNITNVCKKCNSKLYKPKID